MSKKLFATLRVKNAMLFINRWLECYGKLVDGIVVVDNGSTDGTYEVLKSHPKVVSIVQTEEFDEGRDFNILLNILREIKPDWILTVDVDEIFEDRVNRVVLENMMNSKIFSHFKFRRFHLFRDEQHFITDPEIFKSYYCNFGDRSLYRYSDKLFVPNKKIHTTILGRPKLFFQTSYRIMHLPFLYKEYRMKVYDKYLEIDTNNRTNQLYKRDIDLISNPENVKLSRFKTYSLNIYIEYYKFNIYTLFAKLLSKKS